MTNIYERFGVRTIINAKGTSTRVSGGIMAAEVADAMHEATQHCVDMNELQASASGIIAEITGAEAGLVTSGAAAGLLLGTAACVAGLDPAKMNRLPNTRGMANEVVMVRSQRNLYDHAVRQAGVKLIEVGLADRYSGAGVRDAEPWEVADAIGEKTACVFYVAGAQSRPSFSEVVAAAHDAGVPVLVDAAAQLPPAGNLRRFIDEGADLVAFSGGKAILGPQGTGILAGKRRLIASAAMQMLDMDIHFRQWRPPTAWFADGDNLRGLPQHGIGRPCKVGKEQIIGLLTALKLFAAAGDDARSAQWRTRVEELAAAIGVPPGTRTAIAVDPKGGIPHFELHLSAAAPLGALDMVIALQDGDPPIQADAARVEDGIVRFNPTCLADGDIARIARRLGELLNA